MGDLRDKLLQAGLVSPEQAQRAEEAAARPSGRRKRKAARQKGGSADGGDPLQVAKDGRRGGKTRGPRRWYYVSRAGKVPYLEVSDDLVKELEQGKAAIAETEGGDVWLVTSECAERLSRIDSSWIRS